MNLTREQIEQMPAGREMDKLIGDLVMKYEYCHTSGISCPTCGYSGLYESGKDYPGYSTDVAAAWLVVEKLKLIIAPREDKWISGFPFEEYFEEAAYNYAWTYDGKIHPACIAETAPLAICRAALMTTL